MEGEHALARDRCVACLIGADRATYEHPSDVPGISRTIVHHVQTSLARQAYNLDNLGAYQAAALSVRDNLIVRGVNLRHDRLTDDAYS